MNIAIIAVAYNRVNSLQRLLFSLEKTRYDTNDVSLIISVDKSDTDVVECFADGYKWPHGRKIVDKHETNLGLRPHMLSLGKWFDSFDAIVVLEDDIVVSPNFYAYTKQTVEKYASCPDIAGISLYGFRVNYQTGFPFEPIKDEHDVYFMNCAMSWGEVWMRDSWNRFHEWYLQHQEFSIEPHLPRRICRWNKKSWLKYHTRYCIEQDKFFVHPYISLSSNFGDAGVHNSEGGNTAYQVELQSGVKDIYSLPEFGSKAVYYDGFFENIAICDHLGMSSEELCVDLQGEWHNRLNKRFWLTTEVRNFRIIKSFGLNYRPIDANVLDDNNGSRIFLYDTLEVNKNPITYNRKGILYKYRIDNIIFLIIRYGFMSAFKDGIELIKQRIRLKLRRIH